MKPLDLHSPKIDGDLFPSERLIDIRNQYKNHFLNGTTRDN
jgi:hypothetical protein